jgi:hypothetical protein
MKRWQTYLKERFPFPVYLLLSCGIVASGAALSSGQDSGWHGSWNIAVGGLLLFFAELRLMDEYKDCEKDLIAHPERPLPRGLLDLDQVKRAIQILFVSMLAFGLYCFYVSGPTAGTLYFGFTLYLWLMFKEFYIGEALNRYPLIYAITHQIILIPLCLYAIAMHGKSIDGLDFAYAFSVLGSFFAYEVCRKLDPKAHPILKTYLSIYGAKKSILIVVALTLFAAYFAFQLGAHALLWPVEGLLLLSLPILLTQPAKYKLIEGAATLSLLFHLWAIPLRDLLFGASL